MADKWTTEIVAYGESEYGQPDLLLNIERDQLYGWMAKMILYKNEVEEEGESGNILYVNFTAYEVRALAAALTRTADELERLGDRDGIHPERHPHSPIIDAEDYAKHPTRPLGWTEDEVVLDD